MATKKQPTKVKSYEHACEILQRDPTLRPVVDHLPEVERNYHNANHELPIIVEAQNKLDNWKIDWADDGQDKRFAWVEVIKNKSKSGFGLSLYFVGNSYANSHCGSRLYMGNDDTVRYIFKKFKGHYEAIHLYK